jgi:hypothetical protein
MALGAVVVLSIAAAVQPAQASCPAGVSPVINAGAAYLVSNPNWCGGTAGGCYDVGGPTSPRLSGFFWGQGGANGALLAGVDNGTFNVITGWTVGGTQGVGTYYYSRKLADANGGGPFGWDGPGIDGCVSDITPATPFDECTCILLTDSWGENGYFALLSAHAAANGDFNIFTSPGQVVQFAPIPRPVVTGSARGANGSVTVQVDVPPPTGGIFTDQACGCGFGFRVYANVQGEGGMVPTSDRDACTQETLRLRGGQGAPTDSNFIAACKAAGFGWVPASAQGGTAVQPFTSFGATRTTSSVTVNCGDPTMAYEVYLATALGTNEAGGINLTNVGQNSFQIKCSNYQLAEPSRPRSPEAPGQSGDRGRENRGGRER